MNRIKTIKCMGAASVLFAGLFAASAAFAGGYGYGHRSDDDDDHFRKRFKDDDDDHFRKRRRFKDDDDDFRKRRKRRHRDDDDDHGRYGRYGHQYSDLSVQDLTFHDLGSTLEAEATVTGITGDAPVTIDIEAMADLSSTCATVDQIDAGQLDMQSNGTHTFEITEIQDGQLEVIIDASDSGEAAELANCAGADFLDVRVDVTQGENVLTMLCTFATPTADGEIAAENVECWSF
jgi:hypothetical protein